MEPTVIDRHARPLAQRISDPGLRFDSALVDLAAVFDGDDPRQLHAELDDAARPMFGTAADDLPTQAAALAATIYDHLGLELTSRGHHSLLLGHALHQRAIDPLLLAVLGHELARRAGLSSIVATTHEGWWTVLYREETYLPVGYSGQHEEGDAGEDDDEARFHAVCPHAFSYAVLKGITERAPAEPARIALRVRALLALSPHGDWDEAE